MKRRISIEVVPIIVATTSLFAGFASWGLAIAMHQETLAFLALGFAGGSVGCALGYIATGSTKGMWMGWLIVATAIVMAPMLYKIIIPRRIYSDNRDIKARKFQTTFTFPQEQSIEIVLPPAQFLYVAGPGISVPTGRIRIGANVWWYSLVAGDQARANTICSGAGWPDWPRFTPPSTRPCP